MINAIYELKSIAKFLGPNAEELISAWVKKHIEICHWALREYNPYDDKHRAYNILQAKKEMGTHLADKENMFPTFNNTPEGMECRMSVVYFKNEVEK